MIVTPTVHNTTCITAPVSLLQPRLPVNVRLCLEELLEARECHIKLRANWCCFVGTSFPLGAVLAQTPIMVRFGVGLEKLQGLSPWIWNGDARTAVAAGEVEVWGQVDFNNWVAGERVVELWEEVERHEAGVGVGVGEVETMTHL
jgi:hypothetical protein